MIAVNALFRVWSFNYLQQTISILKNYFYIICYAHVVFFVFFADFPMKIASPQSVAFCYSERPACNARYCFYLIFKILSPCACMSY